MDCSFMSDSSKVECIYGAVGPDRRYRERWNGAKQRRLVLRISMPDDV